MKNIFTKIVGSRNDRLVKKLRRTVAVINDLEAEIQVLSDSELQAKTPALKAKLEEGKSLDDILPEAFAVLREASQRVLGMRPYDVQLIGAMVLNTGKIAEMKTGEGKTLMATLAGYLNALTGSGVHVVTVNDYLAQRDAAWMGKLYNFLGLSVGVVVSGIGPEERQQAYAADITYGTNNEFGFDYLRDNMAFSQEERAQRGHAYAIVDEVDSILIDEARTPLVISGPTEDQSDFYQVMNKLAPQLEQQAKQEKEPEIGEPEAPGDFSVDEKNQQVLLTEAGYEKVESMLVEEEKLGEGESLYDPANISLMHHLYAALRAHSLYQKDVHYLVKNDQVIIVDEFTGRTMEGRRWGDGLHQAIEAKENVEVQPENQTVASITFQNYFRLYKKLSGMTGTADTEAFELQQTYGLEVVVIPTHKDMVRNDMTDQIYLTEQEKYHAVMLDIKACIERGQPVLVGTASIEASELLSGILNKENVPHEVLNAKQHEREAQIIEQAGMPSAVTIATNMAGRGTDIVLGGNLDAEIRALGDSPSEAEIDKATQAWQERHDAVLASGGLHIVGSERHESRRIDNQLRGRAGRQGDAGSSRFYLSLEDNLMRIFASGKLGGMMQKLGMEEGEAIEHKWVNKAIENAQKKVEGHNFDIRKHLLEYDDVANDQRKVVYEQRNDLMDLEDISDNILDLREDVIHDLIDSYIPPQSMEEQWDVAGLEKAFKDNLELDFPVQSWLDADESLHEETLRHKVLDEMLALYKEKEDVVGVESVRHFEKSAMLQVLDHHWKDHLQMIDHLRQGVNLRGYAQKDPKQEYKRESFEMFQSMLGRVQSDTLEMVTKVKVPTPEEIAEMEAQRAKVAEMNYAHVDALSDSDDDVFQAQDTQDTATVVRTGEKVGRNDPCPCGSGKKYKKCHGKLS